MELHRLHCWNDVKKENLDAEKEQRTYVRRLKTLWLWKRQYSEKSLISQDVTTMHCTLKAGECRNNTSETLVHMKKVVEYIIDIGFARI